MRPPSSRPLDSGIGYCWLLLWCLVCLLAFVRFNPGMIQTDIKALLPQNNLLRQATNVLSDISDKNAKNIWVLIDAPQWNEARTAAETFVNALPSVLKPNPITEHSLASIRDLYRPFATNFISDQDAAWLKEADEQAVGQRAIRRLYQPLSFSVYDWPDDPLGLFQNWLLSRDAFSRFSHQDGLTTLLNNDGTSTAVLSLASSVGLMADASGTLTTALTIATDKAMSVCPNCTILSSGIPLISEAVSTQAAAETSLIGLIALVGILLCTWLFFRRFSPIVYLLFVLVTSSAFALGSVVLIFERLHVLTFVFGATLLGICVDYVFHAACALQNGASGVHVRRHLWRPLGLSLVSTVLGYALMLAIPVPGLRQMALFCISGLLAAFVTLMVTLPYAPPSKPPVAFYKSFCSRCSRLPNVFQSKKAALCLTAACVVALAGILQLRTANELTLLNSVPKHVLEKHSLLTQRLSDTSPGQFFLVQGPTDTVILERLATLNKRLEQAVEQGLISGASSPYDWLIDQPAQQRNAQMSVAANATALAFVERQLNVELAKQNRDVVLAQPNDFANYSPFASLWITGKDKGAVVLLSGVVPESLNALQQIGDTLEGVDFINLTADISTSLGFYRNLILWIVGFSLLIMLVILSRLYKKDSLHICLPCLLSLLLTLGMLGWFAIPISLFSALPLLLLLGLSIDYALLMHSEREHKDVWASVFLAGSSTLLSFGLLSLSSTPALSHFGTTVLIGITLAWVLTPLLRVRPSKSIR